MCARIFLMAVLCGLVAMPSPAQDVNYGFSVPVTVSGGAMYTERLQSEEPSTSPATAGFRAALYPTLKLGSHWFAYAAVQVRLAPYFYYDAFDPSHEFYTQVIQAFLGYSFHAGNLSMMVKAGRLSSAFGSFPLRYDDAENPLLDQPLPYVTALTLSASQLPCGVKDLTAQAYGSVWFRCGGAPGTQPGLIPVTLYGLPSIEADLSGYHMDARVQITSGSPASPQGFVRAGQYAQWTVGGGYTIRQGFRIGTSGFRGPYLDQSLSALLPAGKTVRNFPASGAGVDIQWARGRWSATGEWQRFRFDLPTFVQSPSMVASYVELKSILTPRFYLAGRAGTLKPGGATDKQSFSVDEFGPKIASYELAAGCWLNRHQLLKVGYEWLTVENQGRGRNNVFGIQFVTSFQPLNRAFR